MIDAEQKPHKAYVVPAFYANIFLDSTKQSYIKYRMVHIVTINRIHKKPFYCWMKSERQSWHHLRILPVTMAFVWRVAPPTSIMFKNQLHITLLTIS